MSQSITVVGVGADGWSGLPAAHRAAIDGAEVLLGGARQLDLIPDGPWAKVRWPSPLLPALDGVLAEHADRRVVVLASGDPMRSGIGTTLTRRLGAAHVRILPGVSSVSLARARLGWSAEDTTVVTVVGRNAHRMNRVLTAGARLLLLGADPAATAAELTELGFGESAMTVLADLGANTERRVDGIARSWPGTPLPALAVLAVTCVGAPGLPLTGGLPDEVFENDGQLTKRDVRAATLARLVPLPGNLLWDIGAGSGSVGIEWSRVHPANRAIAVEQNATRAGRIGRNADRLGVPELRVITGLAPDALRGLPGPDAIFVGGAVSEPGLLDECLRALRPGGRLVANGVTLESERALAEGFTRHGGELVRLGVEQAAPLGDFTGWTPARVVTQWAVTKSVP